MFELKPLSREAIPAALLRANHYRLLNEPREAESICRDVLRADPENQEALVKLLLTLTDQFRDGRVNLAQARKVVPMLHDEYERVYYTGIIYERWAKSQHKQGEPSTVAMDWYMEAMHAFEQAEAMRPSGNDDSLLRWNSCVRSIRSNEYLKDKFSRYSRGYEGNEPGA